MTTQLDDSASRRPNVMEWVLEVCRPTGRPFRRGSVPATYRSGRARRGLRAAASVALLFAGLTSAAVAAYPDKPVVIVVPYSAGGGTDAVARTLAKALSIKWKQPVIVENRGGAEGWLGTQHVLSQPADGYTVMMQISQMLLSPMMVPDNKFDIARDLRLISKVQRSPMVISAPANSPATGMKDFLERCKVAPKPCSFGTATLYSQVVGNYLFDLAGVKGAVNARYKGTSPMMTDLLGEHIDLAFPSAALGVPQYKSGKIKVFAVGTETRFEQLPEIPTLMEQGYSIKGDTWYGLMVRKGTPEEAFRAIYEGLMAVSQQPEVTAAIKAEGGMPEFGSPEQFEADVKSELKVLEPLARKYLLAEPAKP